MTTAVPAIADDASRIGVVDLSSGGRAMPAQDGPNGPADFLAFVDPEDGSLQVASTTHQDSAPDALVGLIGFSIVADHPVFRVTETSVLVDIDADGSFVELRSCLTNKGVELTVLTPEGGVIWTLARSLPYDTEATCTK
ncbi:MAG: hypothetical protein AAF646_10065 [Pseudomonadota bacterium]